MLKAIKEEVATSNKGEILLLIARSEISKVLGKSVAVEIDNLPWLQEKGATFVTLTKHKALRGCIGTLDAYRPLIKDVKANAFAAAFRDPRFPPVSVDELDLLNIEVSLLSAKEPLPFSSEQDALAQLSVGIDGVVFEYGTHRSTFLPQVWEQLAEPSIFMAHLKQKAGLHPNFWSRDVKLYRYTVRKWSEEDFEAIAIGKEY